MMFSSEEGEAPLANISLNDNPIEEAQVSYS